MATITSRSSGAKTTTPNISATTISRLERIRNPNVNSNKPPMVLPSNTSLKTPESSASSEGTQPSLSDRVSASDSISMRQVEVLFEWTVEKCRLLTDEMESPKFSYAGCSWYLKLESSGWISLYLHERVSKYYFESFINVAIIFGFRNSDGTLEELATKDSTSTNSQPAFGRQKLWDPNFLPRCKKTLTVTCRMKDGNLLAVDVAGQTLKLMELETLSSDFEDLLARKSNYDVTIKAKDKEFRAHRAVLAARSLVFAAMFEHDLAEKQTGVVDIEDSDPDSFGEFLQYLYTGRIEAMSFRSAYHLYVTSHKYDVKLLKSFCATYMRLNLTVENFCDASLMADQYDEASLMDSAQAFFNFNASNILSTAEWEALMRKHPRLANRLFKAMVSIYINVINIMSEENRVMDKCSFNLGNRK